MFWQWLLKYSSIFVTGIVSLLVGYVLNRVTTRIARIIYYTSQVQVLPRVNPPANQPAPQIPLCTFSLFLWNEGKAAARNLEIGHYAPPVMSVFPDLPREIIQTPGGGSVVKFPSIPPKTLVTLTYGLAGFHTAEQVISFVTSDDGSVKRIPVMLQRTWPKWYTNLLAATLFAGLWVIINAVVSLIGLLWRLYHP